MKKKILHLITGLEIGGAELMLFKTLPPLQSYFSNEVCCIKGRGVVGKELEKKGIPVHYLDISISSCFIVPFRFFKILQHVQPDLLVTYLIHAEIFGRILGRLFNIKKILSNRRGFYLNWRSLHLLDKWTSHWCTAFIVQTEYAQNYLASNFKVSKTVIHIIPNTISLSEFNFQNNFELIKNNLHIPLQNLNIACVSTLKPEKGIYELLKAFDLVWKEIATVNLLLVGDGPLRSSLETIVSSLDCKDNIFFLGKRTDVKEILSISNIFVLPTYSEGMSNAILEAMASKLPVITTDIPVNKEIIVDNVSGIFVPAKNINVLAEKIKSLVLDKPKRILLGDNAYERIQGSFEIGRIIDRIQRIYNQILETR